jgi:hypothetical protein
MSSTVVRWSGINEWWHCETCGKEDCGKAHKCSTVTQPVNGAPVGSLAGIKLELNLKIEIQDGVVTATLISPLVPR